MRRFSFFIFHFSFLAFAFIFFSANAYAQSASLALSPSSGTFNLNCPFSLDINLNTNGADTDGTDAILLFDPSRITATSITNGTIYADYPGNNIDNINGKVTVSGLASITSPFTGAGILAKVNFKVSENAQAGVTEVKFDFNPADKAKTTDSNVVQRGTVADVLSAVVNGSYTIGTTTACGAVASPIPRGAVEPATPSATLQPRQPPPQTIDRLVDKTGKGPGSTELTYTIAIVGSVLTVLGILGLALL